MSKALTHVFGESVREMVKFAAMLDWFFVCVNVSHLKASQHKRCAFKASYHLSSDFRLKVWGAYYSLICVWCVCIFTFTKKTLGRAQDPRANGAWLSKLSE